MSSSNSYSPFKKPGEKTKYTKKQIEDLILCEKSPRYFIENFVKVRHPVKGIVPFNMYPYQKNLIDQIDNYKCIALCWARQVGKTEITSAYLLWYAMFHPGKTILIVANKLKQALEIMERIRFSYEEVPNFIRDSATEYNKSSIIFSNGSKIVCRATTADAGRGLSISLLYMDELAFVRPNLADSFYTSIQPTLSTGGRLIITSTPNNDEDLFAQIWRGAMDTIDEYGNTTDIGKNGFKGFKTIWSDHPDRDQAWADAEKAKIGEERFKREHCCEFVSADNTLIDPFALLRLASSEPKFSMGAFRWFKEPIPGKSYIVHLDPSAGVGRDYAAIEVFEMPTMEQVGEWKHNKTPPKGQIQIMMQILKYIHSQLVSAGNIENDLFWSFENNSYGEGVLQLILEIGEDNFPGTLVNEPKVAGFAKKYRRGLSTTPRSKLAACTKLKSFVDSDKMKIHSHALIYELKNFIAHGVSFAGKAGVNDDLVSATLGVIRIMFHIQDWGAFNAELLKEEMDIEYEPLMPIINIF